MPTWLNILNNAALRSSLPAGEDPKNYGIVVFNHPLNFTQSTVDLAALWVFFFNNLVNFTCLKPSNFLKKLFMPWFAA